ncbi:hypothetical protein FDB52_02910 [Clostridium botulinum]|uniref:hypothetical protein n=1 Tax=Clostridium botulinum TaxID=1491 RepID=UPI000773ECB1|nr:hypothetical protein [Clostridium botulinum]NFE93702.1 hypothetical protein [Clostridium botulinum]NFL38452.1 hypothetical protein [Clostridium botulinum]NFL65892.1 hypothetical protein [Clostridium botulinum]NFN08289.1 hypothetical protein [Clostridium botulinum]NFN18470.1 hypothetical protein [Clostridium botulinum]
MEATKEIDMDKIIEKAIDKFNKKQEKKIKEWGFKRTEKLMKSYSRLKSHIKYGISNMDDLQNVVDIDLKTNDCDELFILSILQSKLKTEMMMTHISIALRLLEEEQYKEGTSYKYKALEMHYIDKDIKSYEYICGELGCGKNSPKIWCDEMIKILSEYLWGIDGIKGFIW